MDRVHKACNETGCSGNVIFVGLKDGEKIFKCCLCEKEFECRRSIMIPVKVERRKELLV